MKKSNLVHILDAAGVPPYQIYWVLGAECVGY